MQLEERKRLILRAICTEHIARAEPVGSELVASLYPLGVRSATIRNEMAELTDQGYLRQPHTSAGRVPSDQGYRFYVDRLMDRQALAPRELQAVRRLQRLIHEEVDDILRDACALLARLTHYTSIATPPILDASRLASVRLMLLDEGRLLVVLVLESGRVEHLIIDIKRGELGAGDLEPIQRALDTALAGQSCGKISAQIETLGLSPKNLPLVEKIARAVRDKLNPRLDAEPVVDGEVNAIREPEFQDLKRLDKLVEMLHSRQALSALLQRFNPGGAVAVVIGSESGYEETRECSYVGARYFIGKSAAGAIGVVGPIRMRYGQALPAVEMVARQLTTVLTAMAGR